MEEKWYPENKEELDSLLENFIKRDEREIHGIIVPHAGYFYSGKIAGKAFSKLPKKEKAIIIAPSHYKAFAGIASIKKIETPLGEIKITKNNFKKLDYEHAIFNQVPFLQKLGFKEVLPIVVGEITADEAKKIAQDILDENVPIIISTDLSHFLPYSKAIEKDKQTIKIIENLNFEDYEKIDACGKFPLLILISICQIKNWKPKLIEYKNSGDITGDESGVVGYASFWF